jgi:hypothetical protein
MLHRTMAAIERSAGVIMARFLEVADELIDPVVFIDAVDGEILIVEHLSLIARMASIGAESFPSTDDSIIVAVVHEDAIGRRRVPDPRKYPDRWPWGPSA